MIHVFEHAGLSKAPYEHQGIDDRGRPISSCDYCGTCIRYEHHLKGADGGRFKVGNECINKSGDEGLIRVAELKERERRQQQRAEKARADAEEAARKHAAELDAQRQRNHGLTDAEQQKMLADARRIQDALEYAESNRPVIAVIEKALFAAAHRQEKFRQEINIPGMGVEHEVEYLKRSDDFLGSIYRQLHEKPASQLSYRVKSILAEMAGKQAGRKGSAKYTAAADAMAETLDTPA